MRATARSVSTALTAAGFAAASRSWRVGSSGFVAVAAEGGGVEVTYRRRRSQAASGSAAALDRYAAALAEKFPEVVREENRVFVK